LSSGNWTAQSATNTEPNTFPLQTVRVGVAAGTPVSPVRRDVRWFEAEVPAADLCSGKFNIAYGGFGGFGGASETIHSETIEILDDLSQFCECGDTGGGTGERCSEVNSFTCISPIDQGGLSVSGGGTAVKAGAFPEPCAADIQAALAAGNIVVIQFFDRLNNPVGTFSVENGVDGGSSAGTVVFTGDAPAGCPGIPAGSDSTSNFWNNVIVTVYQP